MDTTSCFSPRDLRIGRHTVRIVTTSRDYGSGMFRPGVRLYLSGPNGSPAGTGPKAWPGHMRVRNLRNWIRSRTGRGAYRGWTNTLYLPVPHLRWGTCYRLRRVGGLAVYNALYPVYARLGR